MTMSANFSRGKKTNSYKLGFPVLKKLSRKRKLFLFNLEIIMGLFNKERKDNLNKGLEKTKESVLKKLSRIVIGKSRVDEEVLDNLEEVLISSDVGVETTLKIIERVEKRVAREKYLGTEELNIILKEEIAALLTENNSQEEFVFTDPLPAKAIRNNGCWCKRSREDNNNR